jgi:glyoxylate/hydroxypyruvate reductase A
MTQPESAVDALIENLRRHRQGLPMSGLVNRERGY